MEAVKYDTTKAVWLPRNVYAQVESIRTGLKEFWEVVKTIRDRWKTDSDVVKTAAEAKKDSELPLLRERVDNQREMMEVALMTAIEHGHHDVLRAYVFSLLSILILPHCISMYRIRGCLMRSGERESDCKRQITGPHGKRQRSLGEIALEGLVDARHIRLSANF